VPRQRQCPPPPAPPHAARSWSCWLLSVSGPSQRPTAHLLAWQGFCAASGPPSLSDNAPISQAGNYPATPLLEPAKAPATNQRPAGHPSPYRDSEAGLLLLNAIRNAAGMLFAPAPS